MSEDPRPPDRIDDMQRALADIPSLYRLLPEALRSNTGASQAGPRTSHNGVTGSPSPAPINVLQLLDERPRNGMTDDAEGFAQLDRMAGDRRSGVLWSLYQWARMIDAEGYESSPVPFDELPEVPTVANTCAWLTPTLRWCSGMGWWDEMTHDVLMLWRTLRQVLGDVERRDIWHELRLGGCGFRINPEPGYWRCTGCGQEWQLHEVSLPEAAERLDINPRTLRHWAQRGMLVETGQTLGANGRPIRLFDLDSIRRLAARDVLAQTT